MPITINEKERPRKKNGDYIERLNVLNFALGIRAEEINENFNLLKYWIEAERLRIGGWGLVEGFELSKIVTQVRDVLDFQIHVSKGILINEKGEEIHVDEWTSPSIPVHKDQVAETLTVDSNGILNLQYPVYSNRWRHVIYYAPEQQKIGDIPSAKFIQEVINSGELKIYEADTNRPIDPYSDIVYIAEKKICLHPKWVGKELRIEYLHADDRFDAIFVKNDGSEYLYTPIETGIISTRPSIPNVQDYFDQGWLLIGFAYWHVGQEVDVEFFTGDRTLRKVFVDRNNILYLNGKPYEEKTVIYFEEPLEPEENYLWYDTVTEILYIWRKGEDGEYGWQPVNDLARGITQVYQFDETENADDLQTLNFKNHPELFFMPGKHQITVIIDQVVIMEDQYEELYYNQEEIEQLKEDADAYEEQLQQISKHLCGYGIRFKYPLERPSIIEVRVNHDLNTRKHDEDLFQHTYVFTQTGQYTVSDQSTFDTKCEYEYGASQLEVFRNGLKLTPAEYDEIRKSSTSELCNRFSVHEVVPGDVIDFRVLRAISSYANFKLIIKEYEDSIKALRTHVNENVTAINQSQEIIRAEQNTLNETTADHTARINTLEENVLTKTVPVEKENLANELQNGIIAGKINKRFKTNVQRMFLENVRPDDYLTIAYESSTDPTLLLLSEIKGDYTLEAVDDGCYLYPDPKWLDDAEAFIYITGLRIGV